MTHLVFCPKFRRRVLVGEVARRINVLFTECCLVNRWELHEIGINKDHVHLLIQTRPAEKISEVVQRLKGGSSRVIRLEHPELEEFLWGDSFWSDGYFAESIGSKNEAIMRKYISEQHRSWRRSKIPMLQRGDYFNFDGNDVKYPLRFFPGIFIA